MGLLHYLSPYTYCFYHLFSAFACSILVLFVSALVLLAFQALSVHQIELDDSHLVSRTCLPECVGLLVKFFPQSVGTLAFNI